jgi:hypothetical protein
LVLVSACKQLQENQAVAWISKNQGKKSAKTRTLGFLGNDCAQGGGDSRKPTKNQGENQGSRKPSVLVRFLRQKKGLCITSLEGTSFIIHLVKLYPLGHSKQNSGWYEFSDPAIEVKSTVSDPYSLNPDPVPGVLLNPDPDPCCC